MEQTALQVLPWQGILNSPNTAWAVFAMVLLIFVMYQNGKREERLQGTIDGTLSKIATTLDNVNNNLIRLNEKTDKLENRVEDIEDVIYKKGGTPT